MVKNEQDKETLQENINAMSKWCQDWQMSLNLTKCHSLSFGNKRQYTYELNGQQLTEVNCERDVGVLVPSNLKYTEHCGMVVSKANSVLGLIKRSFHTRDTNIIPEIINFIYFSIIHCTISRIFTNEIETC